MTDKNIIQQIKEGAKFTYRGYPASFVGTRIDQDKIVIEYNPAAETNAPFWQVAVTNNTDPQLLLAKEKINVFLNVYRNDDGTHSVYGRPTVTAAVNCSRRAAATDHLVKVAHHVVIEL